MFWQDHPKTYPLLILIIGLYILKFFTLLVYRRRNQIKGKDNFIIGINTIYYVFFSIMMVLLIMVLLKVNIKEFFTSISILAAAIAIISKDYISNAVNGMILMFNNQLSIGDHIQIGEHKGKIVHISLLNLQLINEEDDLIFIPNTTVLSHEIINYTKGESHKASIEFTASAESLDSIEHLETYFKALFDDNGNVEKGTFKLKILSLKYEKVRMRAEVNLVVRDRKSERQFKRQMLDAWFKYIRDNDPKLMNK
ncbi:MAG TPA: mechanosensitive ion channel domain-containing protein [Bacteroidia bacterium]